MPTLSKDARLFLEKYSKAYSRYDQAAKEAGTFVTSLLQDSPLAIHVIQSRPKSIDSLRGKLRKKRYRNPSRQVTDLIGLRIITYSWEDLDAVATELRGWLDVSERKSRDARLELEANKFGYRSVHLIARLRPGEAMLPQNKTLRRQWFEIQIRSILDHAWSEIEHEVIYKSGVKFPLEIRRRFTAVAGALEVLEHAFANLTSERNLLIEKYKSEYALAISSQKKFDVARLFAFLELRFPQGLSWSKAEEDGHPFPMGLAVAAVDALETAKLHNSERLLPVMKSARFRRAVQKFASLEGLAPDAVSHLALVVISILIIQPKLLELHFPEILSALTLGFSTSSGQAIVQLISPT